jgi:hypothetical protein
MRSTAAATGVRPFGSPGSATDSWPRATAATTRSTTAVTS